MRIADTVFELVKDTVNALGYELDEVEFIKEQGNWVLTLYIDKDGGVTLDDCEKVSRAVDPVLDEADPIEQAYYLSVSSIGLERPLKKDKDFARCIGKAIVVKLYAPQNGKKELNGTLVGFDGDSFTVETTQGSVRIGRKDAASVKQHIDFKF